MVREKLYVTVPSLFRCPISMDVTRSPVSLCTGVTYDRSGIQNWLDSGHDTCPTTVQVLPSKDFVPNLTLHRLIHLWLRSGDSSSLASPSSSKPSPSTISAEHIRTLIHEILGDNEDLAIPLSKVLEFIDYSEENQRFLENFPGFDNVLVRILSRTSPKADVLGQVIKILDSILRENGVKERIGGLILDNNRDCLSSIVSVLEKGGPSSKVESARLLETLALHVQSKRSIAEAQGLLPVLLNLLRPETETSTELCDAVLSCLIAVSATQSTKSQLVGLGLVPILSNSLASSTSNNSTVERCLKLLALVCTCAEGRAAISEESRCVTAVVERMVKASKAAIKDAVVVLWSLCSLYNNGKVQDDVVKRNGVTKILVVLQIDCEEHVKSMCGDLVKVLRAKCKDGLVSYDTKTTHIKPC